MAQAGAACGGEGLPDGGEFGARGQQGSGGGARGVCPSECVGVFSEISREVEAYQPRDTQELS